MAPQTLSTWYNYMRELTSWDMLNPPIQIGGVGHTVQIDESFFSGTRKYHRGRVVGGMDQPWVLGLMDINTTRVVMISLPNRTAETLVPLIEQHVRPRTRIITDGWLGYTQLSQSLNNYIHEVVNHTENFVDPQTGAHTQNIEGFWTHSKMKYKASRGFSANVRLNYLDEIQWRWNNRRQCLMGRLFTVMRRLSNPNAAYANLRRVYLARKPPVVYPV